jgi:hypothetical protein
MGQPNDGSTPPLRDASPVVDDETFDTQSSCAVWTPYGSTILWTNVSHSGLGGACAMCASPGTGLHYAGRIIPVTPEQAAAYTARAFFYGVPDAGAYALGLRYVTSSHDTLLGKTAQGEVGTNQWTSQQVSLPRNTGQPGNLEITVEIDSEGCVAFDEVHLEPQ